MVPPRPLWGKRAEHEQNGIGVNVLLIVLFFNSSTKAVFTVIFDPVGPVSHFRDWRTGVCQKFMD
jgi:hypothetical protein